MRFQLLGPVEVRDDDTPVPIGGPRAKAVLVSLLLRAGEVVPFEALLDSVWDHEPPRSALATLHVYVSRLRARLPWARIVTEVGSYRFDVDPMQVDVDRFHRLVRRGRDSVAAGDLTGGRETLQAALDLRRGRPLADVPGEFARTQAAILDDLWLTVREERFDVDLELGRHAELVPELRAAAHEFPLRERLTAQLMLALHRCGRSAAALDALQATRRTMVQLQGIEPGPQLRRLQQRILRNDHTLAPGPPFLRCGLPRDTATLVGRDRELARIVATADHSGPVVWAVDGMPGAGKTALANHAAHRLADRYPDLQLMLDLRGHTPGEHPAEPAQLLEIALRSAGVPGSALPDCPQAMLALWRATTARRRCVLVLDNAATAAQVTPLLPTGDSLTLVTSRHRLADLDDVHTLTLGPLDDDPARALFAQVTGDGRALAEPAEAELATRLCGNLPLAIRIAAGRLRHRPSWKVAQLNSLLRDEQRRLGELRLSTVDVMATFALSYQQLDPDERRLFRLLGLHLSADFDSRSAAAMADIPPAHASRLLESLVDVHMLQQHGFDRYRFHDLLRLYAATHVAREERYDDQVAAEHRALRYYLHTAANVRAALFPSARPLPLHPAAGIVPSEFVSPADAVAWRERERLSLVSSSVGPPPWANEKPEPRVPWHELPERFRSGHVVGRMLSRPLPWPDDPQTCEARLANDLGVLSTWLHDYSAAAECHTEALRLFREAGAETDVAATLHALDVIGRRRR
ncbi:AfsR/SARP family transcriptional regulator [Amycolatopsis suaedae]|uniref:SARP family transcriptional regulator n=1 Tax=Amycolatopsis suaedae TaxID=2510978 RepID=A0A4Q7J6C9_9PSEU|nr:AfsR/SARP family transcriptional regulator [Amycolatopsis suaedae]RZQ62312.1 SARP family transcriptional regulator [Amycolatopsis suaedae]